MTMEEAVNDVLIRQRFRPKKKKSLVPVGCQLRSWVGKEFILFFYFIFSGGSGKKVGRLFSFKNERMRSSLYRMKRCCTKT